MTDKQQHLQFLQDIITRMGSNSFNIKTYCITLVAAIIGIFISLGHTPILLLANFVVLSFWMLDSYYLCQERKFRGVYSIVSGKEDDIKINNYEMPVYLFNKDKSVAYSYRNVILSVSQIIFYMPIFVSILAIFLFFSLS